MFQLFIFCVCGICLKGCVLGTSFLLVRIPTCLLTMTSFYLSFIDFNFTQCSISMYICRKENYLCIFFEISPSLSHVTTACSVVPWHLGFPCVQTHSHLLVNSNSPLKPPSYFLNPIGMHTIWVTKWYNSL